MILGSEGEKSCFRVAWRGYGMRREVLATWTAWVRRLAPSLLKRRLEWVLTVFSLTKRRAAISRLLRPAAMRLRISSSRGVMASWARRASSGTKGSVGWAGISLMMMDGFLRV